AWSRYSSEGRHRLQSGHSIRSRLLYVRVCTFGLCPLRYTVTDPFEDRAEIWWSPAASTSTLPLEVRTSVWGADAPTRTFPLEVCTSTSSPALAMTAVPLEVSASTRCADCTYKLAVEDWWSTTL